MDSLGISILNSSHIIKSCSKTNNASTTVKTKINWKQLNEGENLINVDKCSNNKVLKEKYYVKRIIIRKQDPKKVRIFCLHNTISSEDVTDTAQYSITNFDIKNRNQNKICRFPQHVLITSFHTLK
jgi:hypothetical protein